MKKKYKPFSVCALILFAAILQAQEVVVDGNMEVAESWTIVDLAAGNGHTETFNYLDDLPSGGSGGCLSLAGNGGWSNVAVCQELTLQKGLDYEISMLVKTSLPLEVNKDWVEVVMVPEMPTEDGDITAHPNVFALNSWDCPDVLQVDGSFENYNCDNKSELNNWIYYEGTGDTTVVLVLKAGGDNAYNILFDEVSVYGDAVSIENSTVHNSVNYIYPNPAREQINIRNVNANEIKIFDATGKRVYSSVTIEKNMSIDIAGFPEGLYFVKTGNTVSKIIKE
jgi:hypothetical protein